MPKPILKKNQVHFTKADLDDFSAPIPAVISSESVREIDPTELISSIKRSKSVIRSKEVRYSAEKVDLCIQDFSQIDLPPSAETEPQYDLVKPQEDSSKNNTIDNEQLELIKTEWEGQWQEKLDKAVETARNEGLEEGLEQAREELKQHHIELKNTFRLNIKQFQETWDNYIKRSETILLKLALEITQFIIDVPLPGHYSDITERILNETLDKLSRDTPLTLSLNPLDLLRMQESGVMELIKEQFSGLRWDPQPTLKEGNWIIQTPRQAIRRITDELLENLKNQFGLVEQSYESEISSTLPGYDIEYIPPVTNVAVSTTQIPLQINEDSLQNVVFSPATSTAFSSPQVAKEIQNLPSNDD